MLLWLRPKMIYESKTAKRKVKGGAVIIGNHKSLIDPIALHCAYWYRRLHFVATKDLFRTKLLDFFFTHVLCIKIDKENIGVSSFKEILNALKEGHAVGVFPEGGINSEESLLKSFKSGAVMMAVNARVPIIPVYIAPRKRWYSRQRIVVGEPINVPSDRMLTLKEINEISQGVFEKEDALLRLYFQKYESKKETKK